MIKGLIAIVVISAVVYVFWTKAHELRRRNRNSKNGE